MGQSTSEPLRPGERVSTGGAPPLRTIVLVGPTAGGKTALAIELALRLGSAEVISADSMQVYRGMDIGTAKPTMEERRGVPHHLIDVADPHEGEFTLVQWLRTARRAIEEVHHRGSVAIVVGGTNLYVRSLLEGIAEAPATDPALRAELEASSDAALRAELTRVDPASAERIHEHDRRRTLRAVELHRLTGRRPSELRNQWGASAAALPPDVAFVGLDWDVDEINRRINERVRRMFGSGLVEEVRGLLAAGPLTRQARGAVGYMEVGEHLGARCSLDDAIELTKIRSRRLGKQQRTWLRRFRLIPRSIWLPGALGAVALRDLLMERESARLVIGHQKDSP